MKAVIKRDHINLMIKPFDVKKVDYGAGTSRFLIGASDDESGDSRLQYRSGAHGARFQRDIHGAVFQSPISQFFARFFDGEDFSMGECAFVRISSIVGPCDDLVSVHNDTSDWNVADGFRFFCLFDRFFHELVMQGFGHDISPFVSLDMERIL